MRRAASPPLPATTKNASRRAISWPSPAARHTRSRILAPAARRCPGLKSKRGLLTGRRRHYLEPVQLSGVLMEPLNRVEGPRSKVQSRALQGSCPYGSSVLGPRTLDFGPVRPSVQSLTRRDVLRVAGGLGLSFLLPPLDLRAAHERGVKRKKSLITIFLEGGASQLETWDPHPGNQDRRADAGHLDGDPRRADCRHVSANGRGDRLRSRSSARSSRKKGTTSAARICLRPAIAPIRRCGIRRWERSSPIKFPRRRSSCRSTSRSATRTGPRGAVFSATSSMRFASSIPAVTFPICKPPCRRIANRGGLPTSRSCRKPSSTAGSCKVEKTLHQHMLEHALEMMSSDQLKAFQIDSEPQRLRDAYGDTTFGRGCLVARRLVETGIRAVEVTLSGFDTHANNFNGHRAERPHPRPGPGDAAARPARTRPVAVDSRPRDRRIRPHARISTRSTVATTGRAAFPA